MQSMHRRPKVPKKLEVRLLADNLHTCCICRDGNLQVQIHHINGNPEDNRPENLAILCLNHHSRVTGDEGFGRRFSEDEVREYKKRWETECKSASRQRATSVKKASRLEAAVAARALDLREIRPIYFNLALANLVSESVGIAPTDYFGLHALRQLTPKLDQAGKLSRKRPDSYAELDSGKLILETIHATKVLFPAKVLAQTVPAVQELAVWVAEPSPTALKNRSENDRYDFLGTFLFLVTPIYTNEQASTFYSGCSSLQVIANIIMGKPFLERNGPEPFGRDSILHPVEKLKAMGAIIIDQREIQVLYQVRYMSDEQCYTDGVKTYRVHDLLGYPIFISNSEGLMDVMASNLKPGH